MACGREGGPHGKSGISPRRTDPLQVSVVVMLSTVSPASARSLPQTDSILLPAHALAESMQQNVSAAWPLSLPANLSDQTSELTSDSACLARDVYHVLANSVTLMTESHTNSNLTARMSPYAQLTGVTSLADACAAKRLADRVLCCRVRRAGEVSDAFSVSVTLVIVGALALELLFVGQQQARASMFILTGVMSFVMALFVFEVVADPNTGIQSSRTIATCVLPLTLAVVLAFCVASGVTCVRKRADSFDPTIQTCPYPGARLAPPS